jgi:hypothetical protein
MAKFYISADMTGSVKQNRPIHCPLFTRIFSLHMQGISLYNFILYIETREPLSIVQEAG